MWYLSPVPLPLTKHWPPPPTLNPELRRFRICSAYPRAAQLVGTERLLAWDLYFSDAELASLKQEFLQEGYFDSQLLMLPVAKSTRPSSLTRPCSIHSVSKQVLPWNSCKTLKVFAAANTYYDWSGGQHFTQINDFCHYALVGMKAHGGEFIQDGALQLNDPIFEAVWKPLAKTAMP